MMKKELEHFYIDGSYGGDQDWFDSAGMRKRGSAIATACDSSLYFAMHKGIDDIYPLSPGRVKAVTKGAYVSFAHLMEHYMKPRRHGADTLESYMNSFYKYLTRHRIENIDMYPFSGDEPYEDAVAAVREQIDAGYPIPALMPDHQNEALRDHGRRWFLINGYDESGGTFKVKAVTRGSWKWVDLKELWDSGHSSKGGFVLYEILEEKDGTAETVLVSELAEKYGHDNRIGAMKDIVELTGTSLLDAKEMVDAYYDNGTDQELKTQTRKKI